MASLADMQEHATQLIRKGLTGSVFVAPYSSDDEIDKLLDTDGSLLALPADYTDVGVISKDQGVSWSRDVDFADVASLGYAARTRRDVISDVTGIEFTMPETTAQALEPYGG